MEHRHHGGGTPPGLHHTIFSLSVLPACPGPGCDCPPHRELFYVWPLQVCYSAILWTLRKVQRVGRQTRVLQVRNNELNDLEGFVMSPGQDIPVANENAIIILVVSASKIKRRFARRIGHPKNGWCPRHGFSFWARCFSPASTCFSNTFLEVLLPAFLYDNCWAPALTNACRENYGTRTQRGRAITKRLGRGIGGSDEALEPQISAACARRARSDYPRYVPNHWDATR
jgi:hypothetical protein